MNQKVALLTAGGFAPCLSTAIGSLISRYTELAPQDIYSGMYARVTINFFGYMSNGKKGVGCGLGNVMKTRDGEPLAGGASAASDALKSSGCMSAFLLDVFGQLTCDVKSDGKDLIHVLVQD